MSESTSLYRSLLSAIRVSVLARYSTYLVNLILLMVYARLFTPEEFGVVAIINVFVMFFMVFGEAGLSAGIVNRAEITAEERDGIFSFSALLGLAIAVLFVGFLFLLNWLYERSDYQILGLFAAAGIFFNVLSAVPLAAYLREKRFDWVALHTIAGELVALVAVLTIWYQGERLLAIAARPFFLAAVMFSLHWWRSARLPLGRPAFGDQLGAIRAISQFSGFLLAFNLVNYFSRNADNILVGKVLGAGALGVYEKSYALMKYPLVLLSFAINPAIQPTINRYQDQPEKVCEVHLMLIRKLGFLASMIAFVIYTQAELIVSLMLGGQWHEVVPLLQILAFSIPVQTITACNGGFWQGMGDTKNMFYNGMVGAALILLTVVSCLLLWPSLQGLCMALVVVFHGIFAYAVSRLFRILYGSGFLPVLRQMVGSMVPFALALLLFESFPQLGLVWPPLLLMLLAMLVFLPFVRPQLLRSA
ncbi:oligosaccharide flippase family protein [Ferrimonas marina]|uniref:Polysaccharide transporter, PST family n=1 Tax=Ferrimonas marina TaxID=299255 RepID=A0A1M5ZQN4_9GAMM|nr:oligosaccharide flippase family protein [Ferrimonas marina]SHI26511.1 polysaccharide transporter, PST family [Ferrimonas marina]